MACHVNAADFKEVQFVAAMELEALSQQLLGLNGALLRPVNKASRLRRSRRIR